MKSFIYFIALFTAAGLSSVHAKPSKEEKAKAAGPFSQSGIASWYGSGFIGGKTANGEIYRKEDRTAAHRSLPFGTQVRVTDSKTGRSTVVRINNRGPFVKGRIIDLSLAAATEIGLTRRGVAPIRLEVIPVAEPSANHADGEKSSE